MRSFRCSAGIFQVREKSRKFDFAKTSRLQRLQRELLRGTHRNPLKTCHERGNWVGVAIGCMRSFRCSTGIFKCPTNQENAILRKIGVCNACNESCCAARIETSSKRATSMGIELALQLVACVASDAAQEFFKCPKNQENAILRKIRVCNACNESCCAARIETRSKRATSVEIELALQLVACASPDAEQEFSKCEKKSRK